MYRAKSARSAESLFCGYCADPSCTDCVNNGLIVMFNPGLCDES